MVHDFQTVTVESAAEAHMLSRRKARFLSMANCATGTLMRACTVTDHELEELLVSRG